MSKKEQIETLIAENGMLVKEFLEKIRISKTSYYNYVYDKPISVRLKAKIEKKVREILNEGKDL